MHLKMNRLSIRIRWLETFEINDLTIALIFCILKKKKYFQFVSKDNSTCEKQKNYFNDSKLRNRRMVLSCSEKKLSALLHGIISKYKTSFYCLNCLHSFRTENKLMSHEKDCENKDFVEL